ncbi:MAG TPA: DUF397 domain-containing protein [Streptosporangiaceae bacterium]
MESMTWRKSSWSGSNSENCVEVARATPRAIAARDSKNPSGPILRFDRSAWRDLINDIKASHYDLT